MGYISEVKLQVNIQWNLYAQVPLLEEVTFFDALYPSKQHRAHC